MVLYKKYYVIHFLKKPYENIRPLECVPDAWIRVRRKVVPEIIVIYPTKFSPWTLIRAKEREIDVARSWKQFRAVIKYESDDFDDALNWLDMMIDDIAINDTHETQLHKSGPKKIDDLSTLKERDKIKKFNGNIREKVKKPQSTDLKKRMKLLDSKLRLSLRLQPKQVEEFKRQYCIAKNTERERNLLRSLKSFARPNEEKFAFQKDRSLSEVQTQEISVENCIDVDAVDHRAEPQLCMETTETKSFSELSSHSCQSSDGIKNENTSLEDEENLPRDRTNEEIHFEKSPEVISIKIKVDPETNVETVIDADENLHNIILSNNENYLDQEQRTPELTEKTSAEVIHIFPTHCTQGTTENESSAPQNNLDISEQPCDLIETFHKKYQRNFKHLEPCIRANCADKETQVQGAQTNNAISATQNILNTTIQSGGIPERSYGKPFATTSQSCSYPDSLPQKTALEKNTGENLLNVTPSLYGKVNTTPSILHNSSNSAGLQSYQNKVCLPEHFLNSAQYDANTQNTPIVKSRVDYFDQEARFQSTSSSTEQNILSTAHQSSQFSERFHENQFSPTLKSYLLSEYPQKDLNTKKSKRNNKTSRHSLEKQITPALTNYENQKPQPEALYLRRPTEANRNDKIAYFNDIKKHVPFDGSNYSKYSHNSQFFQPSEHSHEKQISTPFMNYHNPKPLAQEYERPIGAKGTEEISYLHNIVKNIPLTNQYPLNTEGQYYQSQCSQPSSHEKQILPTFKNYCKQTHWNGPLFSEKCIEANKIDQTSRFRDSRKNNPHSQPDFTNLLVNHSHELHKGSHEKDLSPVSLKYSCQDPLTQKLFIGRFTEVTGTNNQGAFRQTNAANLLPTNPAQNGSNFMANPPSQLKEFSHNKQPLPLAEHTNAQNLHIGQNIYSEIINENRRPNTQSSSLVKKGQFTEYVPEKPLVPSQAGFADPELSITKVPNERLINLNHYGQSTYYERNQRNQIFETENSYNTENKSFPSSKSYRTQQPAVFEEFVQEMPIESSGPEGITENELRNSSNTENTSEDSSEIIRKTKKWHELYALSKKMDAIVSKAHMMRDEVHGRFVDCTKSLLEHVPKFDSTNKHESLNIQSQDTAEAYTKIVNKQAHSGTEGIKLNSDNNYTMGSLSHEPAVILPTKCDQIDSKWTLRYQKATRGIEELVPGSGVLVNSKNLTNCLRVTKDCNTLASMLLTEVFTEDALRVCSLTGAKASGFDSKARPKLDEHATMTLLTFVEKYGVMNRWDSFNLQNVVNSLRYKIQDMQSKKRKLQIKCSLPL